MFFYNKKILYVHSKRLRLDGSCNNNLNDTLNSSSQNEKWEMPYSGNASLIEPEILEDMGVSILEDGVTNYESTKRLQSEKCTILSENLDSNNRSIIDEPDVFGYQEEVYTSSSLEIANTDRFVIKEIASNILNCIFIYYCLIILIEFNKIHMIWMI